MDYTLFITIQLQSNVLCIEDLLSLGSQKHKRKTDWIEMREEGSELCCDVLNLKH